MPRGPKRKKAKGATRRGVRRPPPSPAAKRRSPRATQLAEALDQQAATVEILRLISSAPADTQPIFDAIVQSAARLCDAEFSAVTRFEAGQLHLVATSNMVPAEAAAYRSLFPRVPHRGFIVGRAFVEGRPVHIADVQSDPDYDPHTLEVLARAAPYRTFLGIPIVNRGVPIGAIGCGRRAVKPFTDAQVALVKTFADQAAIAIENARLLHELHARNQALTESLEQQTATGEILRVISSSPTDLQPVFDIIAESAVRLCGGEVATVTRLDGEWVHLDAVFGSSAAGVDALRRTFPMRPTGAGGAARAIRDSAVAHIPDVLTDQEYQIQGAAVTAGFRALLGVPMLRDGRAVGAITVGRAKAGDFDDPQIQLLRTFADQALIAIENVRLFTELEARNSDLTKALEQQTATSEILRVISSSPTDIQPVLGAIAANAFTLCGARWAAVTQFDGTLMHLASLHGLTDPVGIEALRRAFPRPPGTAGVTDRAILTRALVYVRDVQADPQYQLQGLAQAAGYRSHVAVPMLRDGRPVGAITLAGETPGAFSERQIDLLRTFADQAVIAIENVRLFQELDTRNSALRVALEQQTATSELLKVIGRSSFDLQPVFEALAENALRLCAATQTAIFRFDGHLLRPVATLNLPTELREFLERNPIAPGRASAAGRAVLERRTIHIDDVQADPEYTYANRAGAYRTLLAVPMLRARELLGVIVIQREHVLPFTDDQIALMETFADQAAIAIKNAHLLGELQAKNASLTEALDQQTATSEILRVISRSPTDVQPVFDTIAESAARLCDGLFAGVYRFDGTLIHFVAHHNFTADALATVQRLYPRPPSRETQVATAILERTVIEVRDFENDPDVPPASLPFSRTLGYRSILVMPMLREGAPIGAIAVARARAGAFSGAHVALLKTFADQAVIAVENVRLFTELEARNIELTEALEQQTATADILRVISTSPTDIQPVLETVVRSAARFCGALDAEIFHLDGAHLTVAAHHGPIPGPTGRLIPAERGSVAGRAILERRTVHVLDLQAEEEQFPIGSVLAREFGYRTTLVVPLLREGSPVGTINLRRDEVKPFTDRETALLQTFADQAVIAIGNVRLFRELEARNSELIEALDQQTATSEILRVISGSQTDVQPVFDTIVASAVRLCGARMGAVYRFDGELMHLVAHHNYPPEVIDVLGRMYPRPPRPDQISGRAILAGTVVEIEDSLADTQYRHEVALAGGWRGQLAVPMFRDGAPVGTIVIVRSEAGPFEHGHVELLKTFADQAVIAIENVRLFQALEARNRDLTESLEQQTATSEILRVISRSPTDVQPVFDTIVQSARTLCGADSAGVFTYDGEMLHITALDDTAPEQAAALRAAYPMRATQGHASGRAVLSGRPVHIPDLRDDPDYVLHTLRDAVALRSLLSVPMLRDAVPIGVITVHRWQTARAFSDKQIALLQTFADQAVIAVQNVRLFTELEARNGELRVSLEQQTATSELLKVIGRSTFDLGPVFEALADNAVRLCEATQAFIFRFDGAVLRVVATHGASSELRTFFEQHPIVPGSGSVAGRTALERRTIHIHDVRADSASAWAAHRVDPIRTVLTIPMLRGDELLGVIGVNRHAVRPFTDSQIALLETFADQAAIAIENARLLSELQAKNADLTETLDQQTATSEILRVISRSPTDVQPVFDTIARSGARLCQAQRCFVFRLEDERLHFVAHHGLAAEGIEALRQVWPRVPDRRTAAGRAFLTNAVSQIPDVHADAEYALGPQASIAGYRSTVGVPIQRDGRPIGAITVARAEAGLLPDRQVELLQTFADQAVIAIENVRLFTALETRNSELKVALEQQTATSELLKVIGRSTFDLQPVFDTLAEKGVRLCEAERALILRFDGQVLRLAASHNISPALRAFQELHPIAPGRGSAAGRSMLERRTVHIHDVRTEPEYTYGSREIDPLRTVLAVPMLRAGEWLGVIVIYRHVVRPFTDAQIALMETFADQASIAIENARLLAELQTKNADLTETLEQQTATSEILRVISRSPTEVQPVFDTIAASAMRLCSGAFGVVTRYDGELVHLAAHSHVGTEGVEALQRMFPMPPAAKTVTGRVILEGRVVNVPDFHADPGYDRALVQRLGARSGLAVPMLREGEVIGAVAVGRLQVSAFTDKEVALLQTFADQAVIAVQNVRLFIALEARNSELRVALEQQTATSDLLKVIGESTFDLQPVFETLAENAVRLCEAEQVAIFRFDGERLRLVASRDLVPDNREFAERNPILPGRGSGAGRAALERRTVHIHDVRTDPEYTYGAGQLPFRTLLSIPILRAEDVLGAISIQRDQVRPFTDSQIALMETFADQAAIAIENARLLNELQERTGQLTRSVDELRALGEVSRAVSSTLDLEAVLEAIVSRAVDLSGSDNGIVYEFDGASETFHARAAHQVTPQLLAAVRAAPIRLGEGAIGRAGVTREPVEIADITALDVVVAPQARGLMVDAGMRSLLAVPLVREDRLLGGLVISRRQAGRFAPDIVATLQTFAGQSVVAMHNAGLFREVQRQKQYADALVQTSPVAIVTVDFQGKVVGWNPGAVRLFGHTEAEALGREVDDLVASPETREEVRTNVRQILTQGARINAIARRFRKDGTAVDVEVSSMPLIVDGTEVGFIVSYHDITELLRAREEAEAANEAKSAFLATMSHEIRTPMNAVIGMSGLLLNTALTDEQREYAEVVRQSGDGLLTVINDILDFSKIEAGKLDLEAQPFDLRECVESALDLVATRAAEKGLDLACLIGEGTPAGVVGDVTRVRQILLNLLSNAVKFTERGEVVLSVSGRGLEGAAPLHELTFSVRDTGIGISPEQLDRLFQSFSQVDASTTRRYGGTGLGLAISQRLAELMGSRITVTSEMGTGSEFRFALRMAAAEVPVPTRRDLSGVQPSLRDKRVLVVDDNATNRRIVTAHLEVWGMHSRATESPIEALAWVAAGELFDIGILDMHMPEMDGVTLARAIREHRSDAALPLVLFTSLGRREAGAEEAGFATYLHKPIKPSQLFDALVSVLAEHPVHVRERGVARTEFDPDMARRHPLRILLAEDNVVNQKVALRLLAQMGYRADVAANGLEAIEAVARQPYDVVLMDVQMPELDGFEASREINRRWPQGARPRIVAMTANAMQGDRELCAAAGMDDYVAKPIRVEELVAALERSGARAEAAPPGVGAPSDAPAATPAPAINPAVFERLVGAMGGPFVAELIDTFVADARELVAVLRAPGTDFDAFRRAAHSLKSNGETLGATALAALARDLETRARSGRLDGVTPRVERLAEQYESVVRALGEIRRGLTD